MKIDFAVNQTHIFEWKSRGNHVFLMHSRSGLAELELKTGIGMEMGMESDCRHNLNEK